MKSLQYFRLQFSTVPLLVKLLITAFAVCFGVAYYYLAASVVLKANQLEALLNLAPTLPKEGLELRDYMKIGARQSQYFSSFLYLMEVMKYFLAISLVLIWLPKPKAKDGGAVPLPVAVDA